MEIKKMAWLTLLFVALASPSQAVPADVYAAYVSKYIWRGYDLNAAQPAVQPGATVYLGNTGLTLGLWASVNIGEAYPNASTGGTINKEVTEIDYTLTYASDLGDDWNYSAYYSYYTYPPLTGAAAKTGEMFFSLTRNNVPLTPTVTYSYDIDLGRGAYILFSGKNSFSAGPQKVDCSMTIGYDGGQYGVNPGISDGCVALSSSFSAGRMNFTPSLNFAVVNKESRPASENVFWFGINTGSSI